MREFEDLQVWSKAHEATLHTYRATANFPKSELFGLISQMRRASASVPANIAEGCGRGSTPEFLRFLRLAAGSNSEMAYHLMLARDLEFLSLADYKALRAANLEIKKMLNSLIAANLKRT